MGKDNTGHDNTGHWNKGSWNTGHWNTGHDNTGHWNKGGYNTGMYNTGNCNTGISNTGNCNTGHYNKGISNVGYWNTGHQNTGFFNTITPDTINIFNKPCKRSVWDDCIKPNWIYFNLTSWVCESYMTKKEKEDNPTHKTTGGYLKSSSYKEAWANAYKNASDEDIALTVNLPNFDYDVFEEISGIDLRKHGRQTCANKVVEIDGKKYKLTEVEG